MSTGKSEILHNIALVGHAGAGKTTIAEALLSATGTISNAGSIESGNTVCDFDPQEIELNHSIDTALCHFEHRGKRVNIIDTPGYPDFLGRSISILPAVETAAVVINAETGIEISTRRMMRVAKARKLCRMIIINKIDSRGTDLAALVGEIRELFGKICLPLNLPADAGKKVADCFFKPSDAKADFSSVSAAHTEIIDQVVEVDEALMELYLEQGEDLSPEQLHDPFEKALREGHLVPICFVSAKTGAGIKQLLHILTALMPAPTEGNPQPFLKGEGDDARPVELTPDDSAHAIAHVFKVAVDPYVGKMGVFRVHQGRITPASQLFIGDARKPFKVNHLYRLQGKEHKQVAEAIPGDLCAVAKVEDIHFDAVLHDSHDENHFHLKSMNLPPPMAGLAVKPRQRGTEQKLSDALHKLAAEDPSMVIEHNATANETVIRGLGEMHLKFLMEKMRERYNVDIETHLPSIEYRETVTKAADGHHRHKKQTGGAGQFGEVFLKIEPLQRGEGFEFVNKVVGGSIPSQFIPAVEKGVREVLSHGAVAGYPVEDVRVVVYDGKHHSVDSKEVAFVAAGKKAFMDAISKARPIVLEPIAEVEITAPSDSMGNITGELSGLRGRIKGNTALPGNRVIIESEVPVSELGNFPTRLKSLTGGSGSFTMEFARYEQVPPQTQKQLESGWKQPAEAH
ncbi:MAG: elongation factor G [Gammaproteobacteria bacterium]|nr:elongation factor G [Gammaproteobacteria bacterium]